MVCSKCGKEKREAEFFKMKNGTRYNLCKTCLTMHVDNRDPETFKWILKTFDVPYIEDVWVSMANKIYMENPGKFNSRSVLGRYMRSMNMSQYKDYTYADSAELSLEKRQEEARARVDEKQEEILKKKLEEGEISQSEYLTLTHTNLVDETTQKYYERIKPVAVISNAGDMPPTITPDENGEYPSVENLIPQDTDPIDPEEEEHSSTTLGKPQFIQPFDVDESQISSQLTEDDMKYLIVKWGTTYKPSEWVKMEDLYNKYASEYELNVDRAETLKKICKISLKMDQALDIDDFMGFQKLSTTFDALRKSGKFTEAQNKEEQTRDLDSIGELVGFVEREGGIIPLKDDPIEYPQDKIDFIIKDMQNYVTRLAKDDLGLGDLIESYIEKADNQKTDSVDDIMHNSFKPRTEATAAEEEEDIKSFADFLEEEIAEESLRLAEGDLG